MNPNSPGWRFAIAALIFVAAICRWFPRPVQGTVNNTGYEALQVAYSLAHNHGFANPFEDLQSGPTAHLTPLFPLLLSGVIRCFGDGAHSLSIIIWMGVITFGIQLSLWPFVAERLGMSFMAGVLAAGLWLFIGFLPGIPWEADYAAVLVILITIGMYRIFRERCSTAYVAVSAVFWGVTILTLPVVLMPFAIFALGVIFLSASTFRQKLVFVIVPLLLLVPWIIRNYVVFHHVVAVRDNLGMELGVSNNPCAKFSVMDNLAGCDIHPNRDYAEAQRLLVLGEYNYNHQRLREALDWIAGNPSQFIHLTVQRTVAFWFPNHSGNPLTSRAGAKLVAYWVITLVSIPGLLLLWWTNRTAAAICLVWLVSFPPVYYLVQFDVRYRTPILWATMIPASYVIIRVVEKGSRWQGLRSLCQPSPDKLTGRT